MLPRMQMHPDQLPVSLGTVTELVDQQFLQWQGLPITEVASRGRLLRSSYADKAISKECLRVPFLPGPRRSCRETPCTMGRSSALNTYVRLF
jgi:hypothetical protein